MTSPREKWPIAFSTKPYNIRPLAAQCAINAAGRVYQEREQETPLKELKVRGVTVIPNAFSVKFLDKLRRKNKKRWKSFKASDVFAANVGRARKRASFKDSTVFFLAPGRYDLALDHGVFTSDKFLRNEKIMSVIDAVFPFNGFMSYAGSLPSSPGSDAGEWHRDCSLFNDEVLEGELPIYYITVLIPLTDIRADGGPTEIMLGSHEGTMKGGSITLLAEAGSAIILDGRCLHRGLANTGGKTRHMLYIVYCRKWYGEHEDYEGVE
jgi:ectoine hydroxylase-related dioxygenase (phytanoyl-CoA dioxygenase family)